MNSLMVIQPYKTAPGAAWVFDDPRVELEQEPFVCGMGEIIDAAVAHIPNAEDGFTAIFSPAPFPGVSLTMERQETEHGGTWYKDQDGRRGWLCPALFLYLPVAPEFLYVAVEPLRL